LHATLASIEATNMYPKFGGPLRIRKWVRCPKEGIFFLYYHYLVCEVIGTAATPGLFCQLRVIVKMIVEKQMECRLVGEPDVL
jgi:hypothetical protein